MLGIPVEQGLHTGFGQADQMAHEGRVHADGVTPQGLFVAQLAIAERNGGAGEVNELRPAQGRTVTLGRVRQAVDAGSDLKLGVEFGATR